MKRLTNIDECSRETIESAIMFTNDSIGGEARVRMASYLSLLPMEELVAKAKGYGNKLFTPDTVRSVPPLELKRRNAEVDRIRVVHEAVPHAKPSAPKPKPISDPQWVTLSVLVREDNIETVVEVAPGVLGVVIIKDSEKYRLHCLDIARHEGFEGDLIFNVKK